MVAREMTIFQTILCVITEVLPGKKARILEIRGRRAGLLAF